MKTTVKTTVVKTHEVGDRFLYKPLNGRKQEFFILLKGSDVQKMFIAPRVTGNDVVSLYSETDGRLWKKGTLVCDDKSISTEEMDVIKGGQYPDRFTYVNHVNLEFSCRCPECVFTGYKLGEMVTITGKRILHVHTSGLSLEESRALKMPLNINHVRKGDIVRFLGWNNGDDRSWKGDVMDVLSVDYPFIVMKTRSKWEHCRTIHRFDSRNIILDWPTQEYIELAEKC